MQHGPLSIYLYRGGGGGPSAGIFELWNNRCCLAMASGGNVSWLKSRGSYVLMVDQVLRACWWRTVFIVGMLHCSCSVWEDMKSDQCVFVMNLSALFWTFCRWDIAVLDRVCRGIGG